MKLIYKQGIGEILLKRSPRAKRYSITIKPFEGVIVTVPKLGSFDEAENIVNSRIAWIEKNLQKIEKIEDKRTIFDENTIFKTKAHELKIISTNRENVQISIKNGILLIQKPTGVNIRDEYIQESIRKGITETYRLEAKRTIPQRMNFFAKQYDFSYNKLTFKSITSRWGSCSSVNNINISVFVMQLPDYLIDYILLHELCHTKEKNHGPNFWKLLDFVCGGNAKKWDKEVNKYSTKHF